MQVKIYEKEKELSQFNYSRNITFDKDKVYKIEL